jgi:hypothetical protein
MQCKANSNVSKSMRSFTRLKLLWDHEDPILGAIDYSFMHQAFYLHYMFVLTYLYILVQKLTREEVMGSSTFKC